MSVWLKLYFYAGIWWFIVTMYLIATKYPESMTGF